ncbi:S8 family serine peptidase [Actinosynnema sp. NPDC049800]
MRHKRVRFGLVTSLVVAAGTAAAGAGYPAAAASTPELTPTGPEITLLTGDAVVLGGPQGAQVRAAEGREHVTFYISRDEHGDTHVVPEDAVPLLSRGTLDPDLFNASALAELPGDRLPLIVDHAGPTPRSAAAVVSRELPAMGATAVSVERSGAYWPVARSAERVWLDEPVRASLDRSTAQIGAPRAWAAGHTGAGSTVAVLDSGIDAEHPDLAGAISGEQNFTDSDSVSDRYGHGTHVASTITGDNERYPGVAPGAKLLNGKVLDDDGWGSTSGIIAGMEWAAANGADVVNMSFGGLRPSDGTDPLSQAVDRITAETGVLFVVAAGNFGEQVPGPGAAAAALTVGAVHRDERLANFSNRGHVNGVIKPDITAPGSEIVAAKAGGGHVAQSGTSMAAPHVAGAAAILAAQHPGWAAGQLKAALMGNAKPNDGLTVFEQGAGRVDVEKSSMSTVFASVGSLSLGVQQWPHDDDEPIAKSVTYTNTGAEPVTLDFAAKVSDSDGSPAPAGMFTFDPVTLTVPAGAQATTTITTDTRTHGADGVYSGAFTATGGGQDVRTPITVHREVEHHDVTFKVVDHDGAPTAEYSVRLGNVAPEAHYPRVYRPYDESGTTRVRLPKGEYLLFGTILKRSGEDYLNAEIVEPAFTVTGDAEIVLDAREAEPVGVRTDEPNAKPGKGWVSFSRETTWGRQGVIVRGQKTAFDTMTIRPSTTGEGTFRFGVEAHLAQWNGTSFDGSPYLYHVRHVVPDVVPPSPRWTFHDRDLAKVRSTHARTTPGTVGRRDWIMHLPLPGALTEYFTPEVDWQWELEFVEVPEGQPDFAATSNRQVAPLTFQRGRTTTMRWGVGVFGPGFASSEYWSPINNAVRDSDGDGTNILRLSLPLGSDQDGGRIGYTGSGTLTLLRNGEVIGENPEPGNLFFVVEPERAEYTVRSKSDRPHSRLSTRISAEWTFTSEYSAEPVPLPLLAVRYAPNLDNHNAASAGRPFTFPVYVQRNGSADLVGVSPPAIEVSYDDGTTWRPATVKRDRDQWQATVHHPAGADFVSLRSSVSDSAGSSQRQTIIRAYALK